MSSIVFFFQAEDGIRDSSVTGVQTCALPIFMRAWNYLFFRPGIFEPNQQKSTEWNRGGYLVTGAAHCGACHTPKNLFGADKRSLAFGGRLPQALFSPPPPHPAPTRLQPSALNHLHQHPPTR